MLKLFLLFLLLLGVGFFAVQRLLENDLLADLLQGVEDVKTTTRQPEMEVEDDEVVVDETYLSQVLPSSDELREYDEQKAKEVENSNIVRPLLVDLLKNLMRDMKINITDYGVVNLAGYLREGRRESALSKLLVDQVMPEVASKEDKVRFKSKVRLFCLELNRVYNQYAKIMMASLGVNKGSDQYDLLKADMRSHIGFLSLADLIAVYLDRAADKEKFVFDMTRNYFGLRQPSITFTTLAKISFDPKSKTKGFEEWKKIWQKDKSVMLSSNALIQKEGLKDVDYDTLMMTLDLI